MLQTSKHTENDQDCKYNIDTLSFICSDSAFHEILFTNYSMYWDNTLSLFD